MAYVVWVVRQEQLDGWMAAGLGGDTSVDQHLELAPRSLVEDSVVRGSLEELG